MFSLNWIDDGRAPRFLVPVGPDPTRPNAQKHSPKTAYSVSDDEAHARLMVVGTLVYLRT